MERRRTLRTSSRAAVVPLPVETAWVSVASAEAGRHWYRDAAPFAFRGALDRLVGGAGRRWPVPGRPLLEVGDRVGFWEVVAMEPERRRLRFEASVRAPGTVGLELSARAVAEGTRLVLRIGFDPRGVLGRTYLVTDLPAREVVTELTMLDLLTELRLRHPSPRDDADNGSGGRSV